MFVGIVIGAIAAVCVLCVLACCKVAGEADEQLEGYQIVAPCYIPPEADEDTLHPQEPVFTADVTDEEIEIAAKTLWGEAHGVESKMEQAAVVWTMLNRVDDWGDSLGKIVTAPDQFAWDANNPTVDDFGRDLTELVRDVVGRWEREKNGEADVGRVLPAGYFWFGGDGWATNYFRNDFDDFDNLWDWSLPDPYEGN